MQKGKRRGKWYARTHPCQWPPVAVTVAVVVTSSSFVVLLSRCQTEAGGARPLRALITGATGAIGKCLVGELLSSPRWHVVVVGRKRVDIPPSYGIDVAEAERTGRLVQHTVNMDALSASAPVFAGAQFAFCTLGTTRKDAGSAAAFRHVDLDIVSEAARLSREAGTPYFSHVTAQGEVSRGGLEIGCSLHPLFATSAVCVPHPSLLHRHTISHYPYVGVVVSPTACR